MGRYQHFKRAYRDFIFPMMKVFVFIFIGMSLVLSIAASADLIMGLGWGGTWEAIPGGLAFALFGRGFLLLLYKMKGLFEVIDP